VEVRYGPAGTPAEQWQGVLAEQGATTTWLTPVQDGAVYLVKARAYNALVRGAWCTAVLHQVVGKTAAPADVAGLAVTAIPGGVLVAWTASTEADYDSTEVRYGASWAAGTRIFRGAAGGFVWPWPTAAAYTVRAKHFDTSGNESATDSTVAITVGNSSLISTPELLPGAAAEVVSASATAVSVVTGSGIPTYSLLRWQDVLTYTFTPDFSGTVLVAATGSATINTPSSGTSAHYAVLTTMLDSGTLNAAGRIDQIYIDVGFSARINTVIAHTREFTVTSGVPVTLTLRAQLLDPAVTTVIDQVTWRVEKIKR
jgi:hypothetical protein